MALAPNHESSDFTATLIREYKCFKWIYPQVCASPVTFATEDRLENNSKSKRDLRSSLS